MASGTYSSVDPVVSAKRENLPKTSSFDSLDSLDDDSLCDPLDNQSSEHNQNETTVRDNAVSGEAPTSHIRNIFRALSRSIFEVQTTITPKPTTSTELTDGKGNVSYFT